MLKIIFLTSIRSLYRYKNITLINLFGLVLGITSFLFIQHYLIYEFSFDTFFPKHENVYRINLKIQKEDQILYHGAKTPRALFFALKEGIPEIEANGISYFEHCMVNYQDISFTNQDVLWVDEGFEDVFPLKMLEGHADYSRPRAGIISATMARSFFGNESPIGKILGVNQGMPIEITGVFQDLPSNTHLTAQYFASIKTWVEMEAISVTGSWDWNGWWNYIRVRDGSKPEVVREKINHLAQSHMSFLKEDNRKGDFSLQPLKDLHFISGLDGEPGATTKRSSLYSLIAIALITLLIAWINYVNLALAHAQVRSQQIKMRKLIGASNLHLWHLSLTESILLNTAAICIAFVFYLSFTGPFARLFNIPIAHAQIHFGYMLLISGAVILSGIFLSSLYYVSGLSGIKLVSSKNKQGSRQSFQNGLVLIQMTLSIIFLASTLTVYKQISFMKNKDIGIALDEVIICTGPASLNADPLKRQRYESFKSDLLSHSDFREATFNMYVPGQEPRYGYREMHNPSNGATPDVLFYENNAGEGLIQTFQMTLLAGKDFHISEQQNQNKIIINETSLRHLGFAKAEEALGKQVYRKANQEALEIIGVVADFHNEGLQKPIYPIFWNNQYPAEFGYFAIRLNTTNLTEAIRKLNQVWDAHYPKDNLDFEFANDQFNRQYISESRFGKLYLWLTLLSIGIAAMGLYGLILFRFGKRTKEIGVHKVNGATTLEVMLLLLKDFIKWVLIAFVIATPIAWYFMDIWLRGFAYRTGLNGWVFVLAGLIALGITLCTVSWQSWLTARKNPVEALRYE